MAKPEQLLKGEALIKEVCQSTMARNPFGETFSATLLHEQFSSLTKRMKLAAAWEKKAG